MDNLPYILLGGILGGFFAAAVFYGIPPLINLFIELGVLFLDHWLLKGDSNGQNPHR